MNIIYLNTTEKGPSGGAKIIYKHSDIINNLKIKEIKSEVLHLKKAKISKFKTSIKKYLGYIRPLDGNFQTCVLPKIIKANG